jgi:hypothetical protein
MVASRTAAASMRRATACHRGGDPVVIRAAMHTIPLTARAVRHARSTRRALLAGAAFGLLSAAALPAQGAPTTRDSMPTLAPALVAPVGGRAVQAGQRVRLALTDTLVQLPGGRLVGSRGYVEGTLVALDSPSVEVRLRGGESITFPASSVRTLEAHAGAGPCQRSSRDRSACAAATLLASTTVGFLFGSMVSGDVGEDGTQWRLRGVAGGALLGFSLVPVLGRDRWVPVPNWPVVTDP